MLVLSRSKGESIVLTIPPSTETQTIRFTVIDLKNEFGPKLKVGIDANKMVEILRDDAKRLSR